MYHGSFSSHIQMISSIPLMYAFSKEDTKIYFSKIFKVNVLKTFTHIYDTFVTFCLLLYFIYLCTIVFVYHCGAVSPLLARGQLNYYYHHYYSYYYYYYYHYYYYYYLNKISCTDLFR